jgi:hypothetical protein
MERFDQTECGLPADESSLTGEVDCDYCINGVRHTRAEEYRDYHRAQLAAFARGAGGRADSSDAPTGRAGGAQTRSLDVLESDLATLRAWAERLKYASRSQVADFKPVELREIADALGRAVK